VSLVVTAPRTTPTLTWPIPASIVQGTALSATQLNATASVAGTFVYSPAAGTVPSIGTQTLAVTFTPTNTTLYTTATATVSLVVTAPRTTPTLTWPMPPSIEQGTALSATQLNATASVAGSFVYTPAAGTVPSVGIQTLAVTFTPTNTALYTTATATVSLVVNLPTRTMPVITWPMPASIVQGTALSATQLNATASVAGSFVYTPAAGTVPSVGIQTLAVTFTPTNTTLYTTATATVRLVVTAPPCTYSVSPKSASVPAAGGSGEVTMITGSGCGWKVASSQSWLVPSVTSGTGNATFAFTAGTNSGKTSRTAKLTVGPRVVTVSQSGRHRRR
jgi:hypothetical protein